MARTYVFDFDGGTVAQYDAMRAEAGVGEVLPPGARFHAAGPTPTGLRAIDCWDDVAAFERYSREVIRPMAARAGLRPPRITELDVAAGVEGDLVPAEVAMFTRFPGLDTASFRALREKVGVFEDVPPGLIHHVNGPYADGWYVATLWATEAQRAKFIDERVKPSLAGAPLKGEPLFEVLPVHASLVQRATTRA
jgi:hypothetical protein